MPLVGGWVVPHAPVLVPGASRRAAEARRPELTLPSTDLVVVASPHGTRTAVHATVAGSLARFGLPALERAARDGAAGAPALAREWGFPVVDDPLNHGGLVPLWWIDGAGPVVACSFAEVTGHAPAGTWGEVVDAARRLAVAIEKIARDARVAVLASAHLGAGLSPVAPLGLVPGAADFDRRLLDALSDDPAAVLDVPLEEWARAGSCGLGPLTCLATLFAGGSGRVLHYEHPFGVGYVHARVTR